MTQRHRSFSAKPRVKTPVTFDLSGQDASGRDWTEKFTAVPQMPGAVLLDFVADADSGDGARAATAMIGFLHDAIVEDDKERFDDLIRDPDRTVELELLGDVCEWLIGEYANRPTEPSKPQSTPRARSGRGSTATASSAV